MASKYDLNFFQGETFTLSLEVKSDGSPLNLVDYGVSFEMRETYNSTSPLVALTKGSGITVSEGEDGVNNKISLEIAKTVTRAFDFKKAVYDLEIVTAANKTIKLLYGSCTLQREAHK